ncbi:GLPGLI family protein [Polaribacter sp. MSW13]|uniref:GLPGLI family protein n=1 Tax=Polaribacter marinus TaxID=2916838 RepID=A0A9X2AKN3_9FLAO|nr:GLPGLI family protein [Polaribacter marinus]MCI2230232.1 GLPGLI family protein [Polaribacter marinus]
MRKIILLFIITCFYNSLLSQEIVSARIFYKVSRSLSPKKVFEIQTKLYLNDFVKKMMFGTLLRTKPVTSILEFKSNKSIYSLSKKDIDESRDRTIDGINLSFSFGGSENIYFLDLENEEIFYKGKNMSMSHELVYFDKPKWELLKGEKEILGYTCKKAMLVNDSKNKTTVWYTEEIPYQFGPKMYFGLSGLILEIEGKNSTFVATKVEINPNDIYILKPTAKTKTTYKKKIKAFSKIMEEN